METWSWTTNAMREQNGQDTNDILVGSDAFIYALSVFIFTF